MFTKKMILLKKSKYTRKVLSFVLGSMSIIFVVVFIISTIVFSIAYKAFKENNMESALSKLEMLSVTGESTFKEAQAISSNIALESFVDDYRNVPDPLSSDQIFDTYKLINSLQGYTITFRYADECFVFFEESESIVFDNYFRYMKDYYLSYYSEVYKSYDDFKNHIFDNNVNYYELRPEVSNEGDEVNSYVTLTEGKSRVYAVVKVRLNTNDLYNQMNSILADKDEDEAHIGFVAITDSDKQLLMYVGDMSLAEHLKDEEYREFSVDGTKYVSVSVEGNDGFRYTNILPDSVFTRQLNYMTYTFMSIFLFGVLVVIVIGVYLMKRHAKSLNHIMYMVDSSEKSESLYLKIDKKIQGLIEDNALLTNNLNNEKALLLDMFYEKLLKGSFGNEKELQLNMGITGTNINGQRFCVGLFCANDDLSDSAIDSIAAKNISIKYAANDIIINELYAHVVLCDQRVTVLFVSNTDEEKFIRNMDLFIEKFKLTMKHYNYDYYICLGNIVEEVILVKKSYNLAVLMEMKHKNNHISRKVYKVSSEDLPKEEMIEINDTLKNQIYSLVVKGDKEATEKLLEDIMKKIIKQAKSKSSITVYVYILWELLIKIIKDNNLDDNNEYYNHYMNLDIYSYNEKIVLVSKGFVEIANYFSCINISRTNTMFSKILDFINTEFTNPDLSLVYIADKFGISVTKLSKSFRQNNIEYSSHITNLRMNLAKYVLVNTDNSIKSVSKQTGYTSSNSFCRAFKRLEGISPNEYRSNNK